MAGEIQAAEDLADDRHDDVVGQAGDDLGERGADDHRDGEVEDIALGDECAKVLQHGLFSTQVATRRCDVEGCLARSEIQRSTPLYCCLKTAY